MACCKCCCGNADCAEGDAGKCCCGGSSGACCDVGEYCCSGTCQGAPCGECVDDGNCDEGEYCCCSTCGPAYLPQPDSNDSAPCRACSKCNGTGHADGPFGDFLSMLDAYAALGVSTPLYEVLCNDGFYFETCEFDENDHCP